MLEQRAEAKAGTDPLAAEAKALATAEARLPAYLATNSDDDKDFIPYFPAPRAAHDDRAGPSHATTTSTDTTALVPPLGHSCKGHCPGYSCTDPLDFDSAAESDAGPDFTPGSDPGPSLSGVEAAVGGPDPAAYTPAADAAANVLILFWLFWHNFSSHRSA